MRVVFTLAILLSLILVSTNSHAGACDIGEDLNKERRIDGPANIRYKPNGKVIAILPEQRVVVVRKHLYFKNKKGASKDWFFIEWDEGGKTKSGWTFWKNIICD